MGNDEHDRNHHHHEKHDKHREDNDIEAQYILDLVESNQKENYPQIYEIDDRLSITLNHDFNRYSYDAAINASEVAFLHIKYPLCGDSTRHHMRRLRTANVVLQVNSINLNITYQLNELFRKHYLLNEYQSRSKAQFEFSLERTLTPLAFGEALDAIALTFGVNSFGIVKRLVISISHEPKF